MEVEKVCPADGVGDDGTGALARKLASMDIAEKPTDALPASEGTTPTGSAAKGKHKRGKSKSRKGSHSRKQSGAGQDGKQLVKAKSSYVSLKKDKRQLFDITPRKLWLMVDNFSKSKDYDYEKNRALGYNNDHLCNDAKAYFSSVFKEDDDKDVLGYLVAALDAKDKHSRPLKHKTIYLFFYLLHSKLVNPYEFLKTVQAMAVTIRAVSGKLKCLGIRYGKTAFATKGGEINGGSKHNLVETGFPELFVMIDAKEAVSHHVIYEFSGVFFKKLGLDSPKKEEKTPVRSDSSASESQSEPAHKRQESKSIWVLTEERLAEINAELSKQNQSKPCCWCCIGCCSCCPSC